MTCVISELVSEGRGGEGRGVSQSPGWSSPAAGALGPSNQALGDGQHRMCAEALCGHRKDRLTPHSVVVRGYERTTSLFLQGKADEREY